MNLRNWFLSLILVFFCISGSCAQESDIFFCGSIQNDLYSVLKNSGFNLNRYDSPSETIRQARNSSAVLILADGYPKLENSIDDALLQLAKEKKLRMYVEYPAKYPGLTIPAEPFRTKLERGIITSTVFGSNLPPMRIVGLNDCHMLSLKADNSVIVMAKVAGFDKAEYGIDDVVKYPLLFEMGNTLIATTKLSNFATGRYAPQDAWRSIWSHIISWTTGKSHVQLKELPSFVSPMYARDQVLPKDATKICIEKGVEWFSNGRFYIHPEWKKLWLDYQGDGTAPFGAPLSQSLPNGDGSLGLLEGHASNIYHDGSQQYRYWLRADVQGEGAYALAAAGKHLRNDDLNAKAKNLIDFLFKTSNFRAGPRDDPKSPSYGLIGWSDTHPYVYYGDDNARAILGVLGASGYMKTDKWDKEIAEAIMANFRTTGIHGFRGSRQEDKELQEKGWKSFNDRDIINPAPHFESWMWACYLWLYQKTGYTPLLAKTKEAIRIMMEGYPGRWAWTNGIQQERARMVLPLAWLVRVEDTRQHREWLDKMVQELLKNQVENGALREELGEASKGRYGRSKSNKDYGAHEAPLIFNNGDPVADMLYTSNFAFFSLNEAAHATGNKQYRAAVDKLADFLVRIQVKSDRHKDLDGAWFRAFEYDKWEYWASNADAGWGAWGTLTGWTQSWIVATQVLVAEKQSFWDVTKKSGIKKEMNRTLDLMALPR